MKITERICPATTPEATAGAAAFNRTPIGMLGSGWPWIDSAWRREWMTPLSRSVDDFSKQALPESRLDRGLGPAAMLMSTVLRQLIHESSLLAPDFRSFKRQELTFASLNLSLLAFLLLTHFLFASYFFGDPPSVLVAVLAAGFLANAFEWIWINNRKFLSPDSIVALTLATIVLNMSTAFALASLSLRQDIQYFALMIAPIFQAAFRLSLTATLLTVTGGASLIFFWVWNYFRLHPPPDPNEYVEAGTISLIYVIAGMLVWTLVNHLRSKQRDLATSLSALEQARERLLTEERLAAVGRFSSAIAHEIRNPVAMISSALATAFSSGVTSSGRQEMFEIAAKEASRLERLTTDFLTYAHPRPPVKQPNDIAESIAYIADVCRPHATEKSVAIQSVTSERLPTNVDAGQIQQCLLNLLMNAIEASPAGGTVLLRGMRDNTAIRIEIENSNGPIPTSAVSRIFEPFFTTKPSGSGLGLAIAHNIARGHGGDLVLSRNQPDLVRFTMTVPTCTSDSGPL